MNNRIHPIETGSRAPLRAGAFAAQRASKFSPRFPRLCGFAAPPVFGACCLIVGWAGMSAPPVPRAQGTQSKPPARMYALDAAQSQIVVTLVQEGMIGKRYPTHRVVAKRFTGRIELPKDETRMSVTVTTEAKSLTNADDAMSEFERKGFHDVLHNTVLEVEKFPTITFTSVSVTDVKSSGDQRTFTLAGDLVLHGVTRRVSFPVQATIGGDRIRATGEAKLKQSDYQMKPFERGMGFIKIGDETKVSFTVVANAQ
jgi:polyisoprenoid-binding protein YceI